ncbi:MAG: hypothetical protein PHD41_07110 [Methanosarcinaceae archaeon]|nr:hypothetical protein [Methanosarcinaceae archaeon]MDD4749757.1 hypothetical protein [Methanosarcinaceae archaeon]
MKNLVGEEKMNTFLLTSIAFSFFIVCPRMAGITNVIANSTETNAVYVAFIGTLISIPLIVAMVVVFKRYGLVAAMAFSVLTDLGAAYFMKEISMKAGLETFIISLFVFVGVKVASKISALL